MKINKLNFSRIVAFWMALQILASPLLFALEIHQCNFSGKAKVVLKGQSTCCVLHKHHENEGFKIDRKSCCDTKQIQTVEIVNIETVKVVKSTNFEPGITNNPFGFKPKLTKVSTGNLKSPPICAIDDSSICIYLKNKNFRI